MRSVGSVCERVVASAVMVLLAACSGGNGSSNPPPSGGCDACKAGPASVYVIQNPLTFGTGSGMILQFSASASGSVAPTSSITGATNTSFNALATDGTGNVYASYYGPTNQGGIVGYSAGATGSADPIRSLLSTTTTGVTAVNGLAASATGEIFAAEDYGGVQAFSATATGDVAPSRRILGAFETGGGLSTIGSASAIAVDSMGNLYVVNQGSMGGQPLLVFGPAATGNVAPIRSLGGALTGLSADSVVGATTDTAGNLYVTVEAVSGTGPVPVFSGSILEFAAGATGNVAPIRTISGTSTLLHAVSGIQVDSAGNIYVLSATPSPTSTSIAPTILKFSATASGNAPPTSTFTSTAWTNPDNAGSLAVH